jgi:hypothetical protein
LQRINIEGDTLKPIDKKLPGIRQADLPGGALEKRRTEPLFKFVNLAAHTRSRQVQFIGSPTEATQARYLEDCFEGSLLIQ